MFALLPSKVLCWGLTAQSTQWGHVECGQFTYPHFYWADLVLQAVNQYFAHSFARNWQLPFLHQWKAENGRRKYFMIKSPWKNVADSAGVEPATSWSPVRRTSNWATEVGTIKSWRRISQNQTSDHLNLSQSVQQTKIWAPQDHMDWVG